MTFNVSSNLEEVMARFQKKAEGMSSRYQVVLYNNVSYASAVENGYTRTMRWAEMSPEQRGAIFASMKRREEQGETQDSGGPKASVSSFDGGFTITMPPAGMIANNVDAIRRYGRRELKALPALTDDHFKSFLTDVGAYALAKVVNDTPVDQSVLIRGWDIRVL